MVLSDLLRKRSLLVESAAVFLISLIFVSSLQLSYPGLIGVDGYYHLRVAQLIPDNGLWVDISWLPFTVLGQAGTDHHWLWHLLLMPFTFLPDAHMIDTAVIVTTAIVPVVLNLIFRRMGIPFAPLFALLSIAASTLMPGRLMMLRAQNISLVLILLYFLLLTTRYRGAQFVVSFLFMQSYHGAVILVPLTGLYIVMRLFLTRSFDYKDVLPVAAGLMLGLLINPWFPENIDYFLFHTLFKTDALTPGLTGVEWQSVPFSLLLIQSLPVHLLFLLALGVRLNSLVRARETLVNALPVDTALACGMTFLFLALYVFAWRFAEYYVPFAVLSAGLLLRDTGIAPALLKRPPWAATLGSIVLILSLGFGWLGVANTTRSYPDEYRLVGEYLETNATQDEMVFNSDWSDFVRVFWHTQRVRMVNGLDGHFLAYADPIRFQQWYTLINLSYGVSTTLSPQQVSDIVYEGFDSRLAMINKRHAALAEFLTASEDWEVVVDDSQVWLLRFTGS
ncbi:MAG: hypothetical protein MI746_01840 [Pseudomonadales bacterium]|nr:hypothetical protein [Pseudomonadales bacterium]